MRCANNLQKCGLENLGREAADRAERADASCKLSRAAAFCLFFMLVEVVGGLYANSLAVLTDAAHLLTDIAGFAISLFAIWVTSWESTAIQSYGFFRLEILGALVSIQFIWLMTGMLLYEATGRLVNSENDAVDGKVMFVVATLGLFVNIIMIAVLGHDGHSHSHGGSHGGHEHHEAHDHHTGEEELEVDVRNPNGGGGDHHEHHENHGHDDESTEHAPRRAYSEHGEHAEHALVCTGHTMSTKVDEHRADKHEHAENASRKSTAKVSHNTNSSAKTISSHQRRQSNINVEGAYLHVLGDLIQSIGVMMGGAAIWYNPEWKVIDLICTLLFSVLVLFTTIQMLRDVLSILMESTPREVDAREVKQGLQELPGVVAVHELHIWAITMGKTLLTCHIRVLPDVNHDKILTLVTSYLKSCYHISHATIQVESDNT